MSKRGLQHLPIPQVSLSPQATYCVECIDIRKHVATLTRDIKVNKRRKRIKASKFKKNQLMNLTLHVPEKS